MENEEREKVVIAGLNAAALPERERSTPESMEELAALVSTAGGECMARLMQTRDAPDPRTFFGEGKTGELRALAETNGCTLCVFDNELSPAQTNALADELGISASYFSALFPKEMGVGFHEYLTRVRIEEAKQLLTATDYPINQIAVTVGYADQSSFTKAFKRVTGITPYQLR